MTLPLSIQAPSAPSLAGDEALFQTEHLAADLPRRAVRGGAVTVAAQIIKFVLTMGSTAVLARLLTPNDFGLVAMITAFTGFLSLFKDPGFSTATVQRPEIRPEQINTLFWLHVALSGGVIAVGLALAPFLSWFYGKPELLPIGLVLAVDAGLVGLAVQHLALLQRNLRFGSLAAQDLVSRTLGIAAGIAAAWAGAGYWALVVMQVTTDVVMVAALWTLCRWRPGRPARASGVRSMVFFGGSVSASGILGYASQSSASILIGFFFGSQPLGHFTRASGLMLLPIYQLLPPLQTVAFPTLARLADDPPRYRRAFLGILEQIALLVAPLAALLIATADWLVALLLGGQWQEAARIAAILGLCAFTQPLSTALTWAFITQGRDRIFLLWAILRCVGTVLAILAGLPWGLAGIAAGIALENVLLEIPLAIALVARSGPIRAADCYRCILPYAAAGLLTLAVCLGVRRELELTHPLFGAAYLALLAAATYLLLLLALPFGRRALADALRRLAPNFNKAQA